MPEPIVDSCIYCYCITRSHNIHLLLVRKCFIQYLIYCDDVRCSIGASLHIYQTSLESLDLNLLETISNGGIFIKSNARLCYVKNINWNRIRLNTDEKFAVTNNADSRKCGKQVLVVRWRQWELIARTLNC